jgi:hypothetical protein
MHLRAFAVETAGSIIYSEYVVVALVMQNVICMPRIVLSSVLCPALQHVFTIQQTLVLRD